MALHSTITSMKCSKLPVNNDGIEGIYRKCSFV